MINVGELKKMVSLHNSSKPAHLLEVGPRSEQKPDRDTPTNECVKNAWQSKCVKGAGRGAEMGREPTSTWGKDVTAAGTASGVVGVTGSEGELCLGRRRP